MSTGSSQFCGRAATAFLLTWFCISITGFALDPRLHPAQYMLDGWRVEQGFPSTYVFDIIEGRDGVIWIATWDGLCVFDGIRFRLFSTSTHPSILNNQFMCLLRDRRNRIWAGTWGGGLICIENGVFRGYTTADGLASDQVRALLEDEEGTIWVGTNGGLNAWQDGEWITHLDSQSQPLLEIKALGQDSEKRVWVGTLDSLFFWNGRSLQKIDEQSGLPQDRLYSLLVTESGKLLVGNRIGIFEKKGDRFQLCHGLVSTDDFNVWRLLQDREKRIWAATEKGLFVSRDGQSFVRFERSELNEKSLSSLCYDREGNLWIGSVMSSAGDVLFRLRDGRMTTFINDMGTRQNNFIWRLAIGPSGDIFLGTLSGLFRFSAGRFQTIVNDPEIQQGQIQALLVDPAETVWIGLDQWLFHIPKGKSSQAYRHNLPGNPMINDIQMDSAGRLWVATSRGVFYGNGEAWEPAFADRLGKLEVERIRFDSEHGIWFFISDRGVWRVKNNVWEVFDTTKGLSSNRVFDVYWDAQGNSIWFCTFTGINRWKNGRFFTVLSRHGLPSDTTYSLIEDKRGIFWFHCDNGIFSIAKNDLHQLADGMKTALYVRHYTESDGMISRNCNSGSGGVQTSDGMFWYPTTRGLVCFHPTAPQWLHPPTVSLGEIVTDEIEMAAFSQPTSAKLSIPPGTRRTQLNFLAYPLARPGISRFFYKLTGFDSDWIEAKMQPSALYTNITPGKRRFLVRTISSEGIWSSEPAKIDLDFQAYFYQTWWFKVIALVGFAAISYLSIQLAKRYIRAIEFWRRRHFVGHYKLQESIGGGGMGMVFRAVDTVAPYRHVALKVLKDNEFANIEQKKRFKKEAMLIEKLDHPHIVRIVERGEIEQEHMMYLAMELLEGESLYQRMQQTERFELRQMLYIMVQIGQVISDIHKRKIIHRDLKPHNIMLIEKDGDPHYVKLIDFGVAIDFNQSRMTESGVIVGTLRYMSPETINEGIISDKGDVYSMGVIFYEMLTGQKPFSGESAVEILSQILKNEVKEPLSVRDDVPPKMNKLILDMLQRDPALRPVAFEVHQMLKMIQMEEGLYPDYRG